MELLKADIKKFANEKGILCGICSAEPMEWLKGHIGRSVPFMRFSVDKRINPSLSLPSAKSIIVVARNYRLPDSENCVGAKLAMYARQDDYHDILRNLLIGLRDRLLDTIDFESVIAADTGPLVERELAAHCGLGFIGKNKSLITGEFGSFVNLGYMVTSLPLEPDSPQESDGCGTCGACVKACPGNALAEDSPLDYERCASYLTQTKKPLSAEQGALIREYILGCDICQNICPKNQGKPLSGNAALPEVTPDEILRMGEEEFSRVFSHTPAAWAGLQTLKRNATILLSNNVD